MNLVEAIDLVNDGKSNSEFDTTSGIISQMTKNNLEMRSIVMRDDPSI